MVTLEDGHGRDAARNTLALLGSRVVIAVLGWAGSIAVARVLSPVEWGQFSFVFGLLGLLAVVTDLGVGRVVLARLVDPDEAEGPQVASAFIALRAVLGVFGYLVALAYVVLLGYPAEVVRATAVAGLVVVIATPSHALTMLYQARLKMTVVAVAESLGQVVQLVLTLLAALVAPVLLVLVLPVIANELVKLALKVRGVARGDAGLRPARDVEVWRWRPMLAEALPLSIGFALTTLLYKIDVLLLSRLDTFEAVGLYSVGYKFADALSLVGTAVLGPALTLLLASWPSDPATFRERARSTALLLGFLASLVASGFWVTAEPLVTALYGERFAEAAGATRLLVLGGCLALMTQVGFTLLVATGRQRVYPWVGVLGLLSNVGLNLVLIPRSSYDGAAVATVVTEVLMLVLMWVLVARSVPVRGLLPLARLLVVAASTFGVVLLTEALSTVLWWPVVGAFGVLASGCAGWALDLPWARATVSRLPRRRGQRQT